MIIIQFSKFESPHSLIKHRPSPSITNYVTNRAKFSAYSFEFIILSNAETHSLNAIPLLSLCVCERANEHCERETSRNGCRLTLMMVLFYFINRIICFKTYRIYPKFLY